MCEMMEQILLRNIKKTPKNFFVGTNNDVQPDLAANGSGETRIRGQWFGTFFQGQLMLVA